MKTRKFLSILLAAMMMLVAMTACAVTSLAESADPTTITVLLHASWLTPSAQAAFDYVADELNVKFEFIQVAEGTEGDDLMGAKISAGDTPDLVWWYGAQTAKERNGLDKYADVSGDWMQYYNQDVLKVINYYLDGKWAMAPFGSAFLHGMFYNKQVFADNGIAIPQNWDEFLAACETLKAAEVTPVFFGSADIWPLGFWYESAMAVANKADPTISEKTQVNEIKFADIPILLSTVEGMKYLADNGLVNATNASDTFNDALNAILDGSAAMFPMVSNAATNLQEVAVNPSDTENIGFFILPIKGVDSSDLVARINPPFGLLVPSEGKNVDLSLKVLDALCSPGAQQAMFDTIPGLPFILGGVNGNVTGGVLLDAFNIMNSGKVSVGFVEPPYNGGVAPATYIQDMLAGNITPMDVLNSLDEGVTRSAQNAEDPNW